MKKLVFFLGLFAGILNAEAQTLFINEVIALNDFGQMDVAFEYDDWIEIYNAGGIINLAGYYLSDDPLNLTKYQIPATNPGITTVLPGGYIIFWADKDNLTQGENHTNFSLSGNGETVFFTAPDGVTIIDQLTYPQMATDISYGRSCDGCPALQYFNNVTYNASNFETPPNTEILFINEIQAENTGIYHDPEFEFDPWIEIYNPNPYQVNVGGYYLSVNGTPTQWQIPTTEPFNTVIPAGAFRVFWCDNDLAFGASHTALNINSAGGTATLTAPDGTSTVDALTWSALQPGQSAGRSTDGAPSIITFNPATPINSNTLIFITPDAVVINEVMAKNVATFTDNFGEFDDWVEIYNPLGHAVSLAGYYMSDDSNNPRRWQIPTSFPDSVTVQAYSWLTFFADGSQSEGVRHCNFSLNNNNEFVGLYSPDGLTRVDEIVWNHMGADTSLGRLTDGAAQWVSFIVTTPDYSNNQGVVSISEFSDSNAFSLYPNPTRGIIQCSKKSDIRIYNAQGHLVSIQNGIWQINFTSFASGIYFVLDETGNTIRVIRE